MIVLSCYTLQLLGLFLVFLQVVILDVRVPCTPVARLNNHRACVNGIAWAPHSSCHICTAGNHGGRKYQARWLWWVLRFCVSFVIYSVEIGSCWIMLPGSDPLYLSGWAPNGSSPPASASRMLLQSCATTPSKTHSLAIVQVFYLFSDGAGDWT
jgi:hypothetical protein